jgi:hypothetical protein
LAGALHLAQRCQRFWPLAPRDALEERQQVRPFDQLEAASHGPGACFICIGEPGEQGRRSLAAAIHGQRVRSDGDLRNFRREQRRAEQAIDRGVTSDAQPVEAAQQTFVDGASDVVHVTIRSDERSLPMPPEEVCLAEALVHEIPADRWRPARRRRATAHHPGARRHARSPPADPAASSADPSVDANTGPLDPVDAIGVCLHACAPDDDRAILLQGDACLATA